MNRRLLTYLLISVLFLFHSGCRQAKYVSDGDYLLKKNKIEFVTHKKGDIILKGSHPLLNVAEMTELVRPSPNRSVKLFFYNRIDTLKHQQQVLRKEEKYRSKNEKRKTRENRINNERITKAEENGDSLYKHKVVYEKQVRLGWREWVVVNLGQPPIELDTARVRKSKKQLEIYLKKKGFYYGTISDTVIYNTKKKKAEVLFVVNSGDPYRIRNVILDSASVNIYMRHGYKKLTEEKGALIVEGNLLDQDVLERERSRFTQYCRNEEAMFGFNQNYISYVVDTTVGNMQADVILFVKPKIIKDPYDPEGTKKVEVPHMVYRIRDVIFRLHNPDEESFKSFTHFKLKCDALIEAGRLDSLTPNYTYLKGENKGTYPLLDTIHIEEKGWFIYNEKPFINPDLLDKQNFLEIDMSHVEGGEEHYYKDYYVERSYNTMSDLGLFANITPRMEVEAKNPLGRWLIITYDLIPKEKQGFLLEPRLSNTNGILGIGGEVSYTNTNLYKGGAQQLRISIVGAVESQPLILGTDESGDAKKRFGLNTFEWGPKISLTYPKIVPYPKKQEGKLSKRLYPKTIFDLNLNFQKRAEFKRNLFELGYALEYKSGKTQSWNLKLMELNFVNLTKEDFFQEKLNALNDPAYLNSYEDHLTLLTSLAWHYNNLNSNTRTKKHLHDLNLRTFVSGQFLTPVIYNSLVNLGAKNVGLNDLGQREFFNVPYTQFWKIEGQYISSVYLNKKNSLAFRTFAGVGFAVDFWTLNTGNLPSLPYEQAYFAGGSNDIRAFKAKEMAPGSVKTYADANSTQTQIGDMKLEANFEWRFEMTSLLEGALFIDGGNIWNIRRDTISASDPAVFKPTFYKEIALGVGYGIRADFDFLIVRLDLSFALHNPHMPVGERWWLSSKENYKSYFAINPETGKLIDYEAPHPLVFNFGIGYPF